MSAMSVSSTMEPIVHVEGMKPSEILREAARKELKNFKGGARAFEREHNLEKWTLRGFTVPSREQVPSLDRAANIAKALGLEFYLGPPRAIEPEHVETKVDVFGPSQLRRFEAGVVEELVWVDVQTENGHAKLMMPSEDAKILADQLTYRAMQIEE